uniref:Plasmid pRiA4b Orf3-like domain-containing protein n=1 Tax=candidate division WOR-3 bacterium TaxID=2052148 RepID=A0A7C6EKL1_UNCW3
MNKIAGSRESKPMILTLSIECVWGVNLTKPCKRIVEISADATLNDLHEFIQDIMDFGRDHPYEFYFANNSSPFAKKIWVTKKEDWKDKEDDFASVKLGTIWPLGRKKLYYIFGFGDRWIFEIHKKRGAKPPKKGISYPRVIGAIGPKPRQYQSI